MKLENVRKETELTQKLLEIFSHEENTHHFEDTKYKIDVNMEHYVLEYWHMNKKNPEEIGKWKNSHPIKSRESYQIPGYVFAFQFYDLIKININGEFIEGKTPYNESPIIYIGERYTLETNPTTSDDHTIIIDKDGDIHFGKSGITYQEYFEVLKEKNPSHHRKMRIPNLKEN